jgi:hypothetical protein
LIAITDSQLLLAAADASSKVFDENFKMDSSRYSFEFNSENDRHEAPDQGKVSSESVLVIADTELHKPDPHSIR